MTEETLRFVLQVIGVFVGGSAVQLLIFLIRRRAEVRQLDVSSDVNLLSAAQAQIKQNAETETELRRVIADKDDRYAALERRLTEERSANTRALGEADQVNAGLSAELARARAELATARYQLEQVDPRRRRGNWEG